MQLQDLYGMYFIQLFGEGYYSGQCCSHTAFITEELYLENKERIEEYVPTFYELDGKYSEVEGSTNVTLVDESTVKEALILNEDADDDYKIWESMLDGCDTSSMEPSVSINDQIKEAFKVKTVTTYSFNGEILQ